MVTMHEVGIAFFCRADLKLIIIVNVNMSRRFFFSLESKVLSTERIYVRM